MTAVSVQLATAYEEAGHLLAGESVGRTARGLWLSEDAACVQFEDGGNISPDSQIWTTIVGPVAKAMHLDPSWRDFDGLARHLLSGWDNDGRTILLAFQQKAEETGRQLTRDEARKILAGRAERARKFVIDNGSRLTEIVDDALAGKLQPRAYPEGAKLAYANGQAIGYVQPEHVYAMEGGRSTYRRGEGVVAFARTDPPRIRDLPVVEPFAAQLQREPEPIRPLKILRDAAGRVLGIGREGEAGDGSPHSKLRSSLNLPQRPYAP